MSLGHQRRLIAKDGRGIPLIDEPMAAEATHEDTPAQILGWVEREIPPTQPRSASTKPSSPSSGALSPAHLHQPHHLAAIDATSSL